MLSNWPAKVGIKLDSLVIQLTLLGQSNYTA
jgi:hypothetical protein